MLIGVRRLPQLIYIGCAYATVYLIYMKFRATYDGNHDSFRMEFLIVPVGGLAVLVNHDFSFLEVSSVSELGASVGMISKYNKSCRTGMFPMRRTRG